MKIQINFDSWEELCRFLATASADGLPENTRELAAIVNEAKKEEPVSSFAKAKEAVEQLKAEAEKETEEAVPFEETAMNPPEEPKEEPKVEAPEYKLADVQKAVRELVKAKGKDTAKAVLQQYGATGASSVRAENYAAVINDLKEALNG